MSEPRIAWLAGDGVGPAVCAATRTVLNGVGFAADYVEGDVGWRFWEEEGDPLPPRTREIISSTDCCFFGAITSKPLVPGYRSPIVRIRQDRGLYANLRPCRAIPGNPNNYSDSVDVVMVRENTECLYGGIEVEQMTPALRSIPGMENVDGDAAVAFRIITPSASERICREAFEYARTNGRSKVTCVHKANVMRLTDGIFLRKYREVAEQYPDIQSEEANVDAVALRLIREPEQFDVLVTTNLFGDILSDELAQLAGGLGTAASANVGADYALFEPVHGSAPDLNPAHANPAASLLAASMMLDWLGEGSKAGGVRDAVEAAITDGRSLTRDMGGTCDGSEFVASVLAAL